MWVLWKRVTREALVVEAFEASTFRFLVLETRTFKLEVVIP